MPVIIPLAIKFKGKWSISPNKTAQQYISNVRKKNTFLWTLWLFELEFTFLVRIQFFVESAEIYDFLLTFSLGTFV